VRVAAALVLIGVVLAGSATDAAAQETAGTVCARVGAGAKVGTVTDPALVELSGLVARHTHPGVLWAHNDSGGFPVVYALSATGKALGAYPVEGAEAVDWEDIGIGPGPEAGRSYLYLADIGDNGSARDHVIVYRVAEPGAAPDGTGGTLPLVDALTIRYPEGPADAESLFVDPLEGDVYVITKNLSGRSRVLRAGADVVAAGGSITMEEVARFQAAGLAAIGSGRGLPATMVTAADISPDGSTVLVRTYQDVLVFERPQGRPLAEAFEAKPCSAPSLAEPQGEAIAFADDGASYVTIGEGAGPPVHRFEIDPPIVATTVPAATTTRPSVDPDPGDEDDSDVLPIVLLVGFLVVAGVIVLVAVRSRPSRRHE